MKLDTLFAAENKNNEQTQELGRNEKEKNGITKKRKKECETVRLCGTQETRIKLTSIKHGERR